MSSSEDYQQFRENRIVSSGSSIIDTNHVLHLIVRKNCKGFAIENIYFGVKSIQVSSNEYIKISETMHPKTKISLISLKGTIMYEYFFRSRMEGPFSEKQYQQHFEKVDLVVTYKNKYPFRIHFIGRQTNSPLFANFLMPNVKFDINAFRESWKNRLITKAREQLEDNQELRLLKAMLDQNQLRLQMLNSYMKDPGYLQRMVEKREEVFFREKREAELMVGNPEFRLEGPAFMDSLRKLPAAGINKDFARIVLDSVDQIKNVLRHRVDSAAGQLRRLNNNAAITGIRSEHDSLLSMKKKLLEQADSIKRKYDSLQNLLTTKFNRIRGRVMASSTSRSLEQIADSANLGSGVPGGLDRVLSNFRALNIGRQVINYSELTIQNLVVSGLNVEYSPGWYSAFSAGKIDFRMRDFFQRRGGGNDQYIAAGRWGYGNRDRKMVILTLYRGRKDRSEFGVADTVRGTVDITGYSVEFYVKKNEQKYISAEVAKSTPPDMFLRDKSSGLQSLVEFNDIATMAFHVKAGVNLTKTNTTFSGFLRSIGSKFQSFSTFTFNTGQQSWLIRADQRFFKNKLTVNASVRRNEFVNPFIEQAYKTSAVFGSVQATLRMPKLPFVSVGYYPSAQLFLIDDNILRQQMYYTLHSTLTHTYGLGRLKLSSSMALNCFLSKSTDSGFINNSGYNYLFSQSLHLKKATFQLITSFNKQEALYFNTYESAVDLTLGRRWKSAVSFQLTAVRDGSHYGGGRIQLDWEIPKLGQLHIQFDRSYMPTISNSLFPIESGRLSWTKNF